MHSILLGMDRGSSSDMTSNDQPAEKSIGGARGEPNSGSPGSSAALPPKMDTPQPPKVEAAQPDQAKSEQPEMAKPEVAKPETTKPEAVKLEAAKAEAAKEEVAKPEEAKPVSAEAGQPEKPKVEAQPDSLAATQAPVQGGDTARRPAAPIDPGEAHVLVVEDNVPNFVLIARMLAYMGVQRCEWKTSGWQVVEFADTLPRIDLILMDIRLPYEDGFQALLKVRANPRLKDTLVVAVTAEASVEQMKRAKEAGFDGFLGKPLDPDRFPDQIKRVLSGEPVWEIH